MIFLRDLIRWSAVALVAASAALTATPGFAVPRYDGLWSVSIVTKKGDCVASYRYPMRIANGFLANGGAIALDGLRQGRSERRRYRQGEQRHDQRHRLRPPRRQCRQRLLARRFLLGLMDGGAAEFVRQFLLAACGERVGWGAFPPGSESRKSPLTLASHSRFAHRRS